MEKQIKKFGVAGFFLPAINATVFSYLIATVRINTWRLNFMHKSKFEFFKDFLIFNLQICKSVAKKRFGENQGESGFLTRPLSLIEEDDFGPKVIN